MGTKRISKTKIINVVGAIDYDTFKEFQEELDEAIEDKDIDSIHVIVTSEGGDSYIALAFYDTLCSIDKPLSIEACGLVASAAVLLLAVPGARSIMTSSSWVMVHEDSSKISGSVAAQEREIAHSRRLETQWCQILAANTTTSYEKWTELHKAETYLSAQECKELGLIDEVV